MMMMMMMITMMVMMMMIVIMVIMTDDNNHNMYVNVYACALVVCARVLSFCFAIKCAVCKSCPLFLLYNNVIYNVTSEAFSACCYALQHEDLTLSLSRSLRCHS